MALTCNGSGEIEVASIIDEVNGKADKAGDIFTGAIEVPAGATGNEVPNVTQNDATYLKLTGGNVDELSIGGKSISPYKGRNRIINGNFKVWQEGTSKTFTTNTSAYIADLYYSFTNTDGSFTVSKGLLDGSNSLKTTVNTVTTDITAGKYLFGIQYKPEAQDVYDLNGKDVTISFKIKANFTGKMPLSIIEADYSKSYVTEFDVVANQVVKVEKTIPFELNTVAANDNSAGLSIIIGFQNEGVGATPTIDQWILGNYQTTPNCISWSKIAGATWEIAELQLEEGNVATQFEYEDYGTTLIKCQRYIEVGYIDIGRYGYWPYQNIASNLILGSKTIVSKRIITAVITKAGGVVEGVNESSLLYSLTDTSVEIRGTSTAYIQRLTNWKIKIDARF